MQPRLKLFTGEDESMVFEEPMVRMKLGEVCQILSEAGRYRRSWLSDFADDEIQVSSDLYEVLTTYWQLKPGA